MVLDVSFFCAVLLYRAFWLSSATEDKRAVLVPYVASLPTSFRVLGSICLAFFPPVVTLLEAIVGPGILNGGVVTNWRLVLSFCGFLSYYITALESRDNMTGPSVPLKFSWAVLALTQWYRSVRTLSKTLFHVSYYVWGMELTGMVVVTAVALSHVAAPSKNIIVEESALWEPLSSQEKLNDDAEGMNFYTNAFESSSLFSKLTFSWMNWLLEKGNQRELTLK
eukprot:Trichotokara_eunicae@DN10507_c0_g1_i1.p1